MSHYLVHIFLLSCFFIFPAFAGNLATNSATPLETNGVVPLYVAKGNGYHFRGSAVFIGPHTLATAFHVIERLKSPVKEHLFFKDKKSHRFVPITKLSHLDLKNDLAILQVKDYHSKFFHSIGKNPKNFLKKIFIVGFPKNRLQVINGKILVQYDFSMDINYNSSGQMEGVSGGGVFYKKTGSLAGIMAWGFETFSYTPVIPVARIRDLLSQKPLSCVFEVCVKNQLKRINSLARDGDAVAQYRLAHWYASRQNKHLALYWLHKSSRQNFPQAQYMWSDMLWEKKTKKDSHRAMSLLKRSAKQGYIPSQYRLASVFLREGGFSKKDYVQAIYWMKQAARGGLDKAQYLASVMSVYEAKNKKPSSSK